MVTITVGLALRRSHDIEEFGRWIAAERDMRMVGTAPTIEVADRLLVLPVSVVVIDSAINHRLGMSWCRKVRGQPGAPAVIIRLNADEDSYLACAFDADAASVLPVEVTADRLIPAIRSAARGERDFTRVQLGRMRDWRAAMKQIGGQLTEREGAVVSLLLHRHNASEIGKELDMGRTTADRHIANILNKTGHDTRGQLIAAIYEQHLENHFD